ncbi:MAG: glycerate kinase type-2 family protein [Candidatus Acidiferrales bacterium]
MKQIAQRIFRETLAAIDIPATLTRKLDLQGSRIRVAGAEIDLRDFRELVAIVYGKAAFAMAGGLIDVLAPEYSPEGIIVAPAAPPRALPGWQTFIGGHPVPTAESFAAGRAILDRLARCDERSMIFFLISGGGSALVEQPLDPSVTLEDFQKLHHALVTCGAPIEEINAIRKHVSATKGGRLAAATPRSTKLTLGVSDVPPGKESALASGPTLPDPTTVGDAERIARQYGLLAKLPASLQKMFERHELRETPKENDPAFARSHFALLLSEHDLTHSAHHACEAGGHICLCDVETDNWPIEKAANHLLALLESQRKAYPGRPVAIIANGEVSSPVTGDGVGGRNSAFVLAFVPKIVGKKITVLSAGTDGIDGNSPAAGAVADGETMSRAQAAGLDVADFLRRSDAYNFFHRLGDAIITGPTGNNLRDLRILLAHS